MLANVQDVAKASLEVGDIPQMTFKHYRELVQPADGQKWYAVTSEAVEALKQAKLEGVGKEAEKGCAYSVAKAVGSSTYASFEAVMTSLRERSV